MNTHSIYSGKVRHRRFTPCLHSFSYPITMLGINVKQLASLNQQHWILGTQWYKPVRFVEQDYIKSEPGDLFTRIKNKVARLGGNWDGSNVMMLAQCRCLGIYFSPVNFYFCYQASGECHYMLAEVSNTPWNERHYYLVNIKSDEMTDKAFHVSPFMDMAMKYKWRVHQPEENAFIHIENMTKTSLDSEQNNKVFDATVAMTQKRMHTRSPNGSLDEKDVDNMASRKDWLLLPLMNFKIVQGIYWQALKLFIKKVPFVPYSRKQDEQPANKQTVNKTNKAEW